MRPDGRRALVLGGGGEGIGRAVGRALAVAGASLVLADRDADRAADAAQEARSSGVEAHPVACDVTDAEQLRTAIAAADDLLGGLDTLVTVVGGQVAFVPSVRLHEMADADWDTVYELNLRYVARAVRQVLSLFLPRGGGTIVSVGSVTGFLAAPRQGAYGVAKSGLLSLARTVAAEYSADGIRMNVVAGGAIATAASGNDAATGWVDDVPAGRYGTPEEIAAAVVYLAGPDSAYVTGQQIVLDGGVSTRGPFA